VWKFRAVQGRNGKPHCHQYGGECVCHWKGYKSCNRQSDSQISHLVGRQLVLITPWWSKASQEFVLANCVTLRRQCDQVRRVCLLDRKGTEVPRSM
jgi:hypothetical protein